MRNFNLPDMQFSFEDVFERSTSHGQCHSSDVTLSTSDTIDQEVLIPGQLLQAAGAVSSVRDAGNTPTWQPQRRGTMSENPLMSQASAVTAPRLSYPAVIHRPSTTLRGESITAMTQARSESLAARAAPQVGKSGSAGETEQTRESKLQGSPSLAEPRNSREIPYPPGIPERLALNSKSSTQDLGGTLARHTCYDLGAQTFTDPFRDRPVFRKCSTRSSVGPFRTRSNSFLSDKVVDDGTERSKSTSEPDRAYVPASRRGRAGTMATIVDAIIPDGMQRRFTNELARRNTLTDTFKKAKLRGKELQRNKWAQIAFEYGIYIFLLLFVYFVLVGMPLWRGAVWWCHWIVANEFVLTGGFSITLGIAVFYAFGPLLVLFEKEPPANDMSTEDMSTETRIQPNVQDTALLIPCYKSAGLIAATLEAALKIFPPTHVFVLANGNSPEPLDNTEEICRPYGVNHIWSPVGSKIVAQFVGCYAAKSFKNVLLIDDDCALPENFPVVTDRFKGNVKCIGYTIKSVGPGSTKGNYCQQAQDLEYKLSGLQRDFAGRIGSATFPHGAIALWDRRLLVKTFHQHPGFSVSEDWFFGHAARQLGCRIKMCSSVFVETETPTAVFLSGGGSRGGFGEMTIFSQRFKRWNFFFVNGMWYNLSYIFCNWKLGWWEIGAKIFVFQEVYETLLYLLTPFILPISFVVRPSFCGLLLGSTIIMYLVNVIIFNEVHLRRKNERIDWVAMYVYYLPYKIVLTGINVASCYWSLWKYARYFAKRHPKVVEDENAVGVVVRFEENAAAKDSGLGRRLTVRTISTDGFFPVLSDLSPKSDDGTATCEPEQPISGMSTPTRLAENIGTVDFSVHPSFQ